MGRKKRASILTLIVSILNTGLSIVFSLIYNNLLIVRYGSGVNGLIATLTQFVSLFAVLEGGFSTAVVVATYSPIVNQDYQRLNDILYTAKKYLFKLGTIITIAVAVTGSVYVLCIESPYGYLKTYILLIFSVAATGLSLCYLSKYSVLLSGDNKDYIQIIFSLVSRTVTWGLSIYFIFTNQDILLIFFTNVLNTILVIILYHIYEKKHYPMVTYAGQYDKSLINGTKDVFFQKIASTVFTSTDLVLISVCISVAYASVYNLYFQVFKSVLMLLASIIQAPFNSFGHLYKETDGREKINDYFDLYQHMALIICSVVLAVTGSLIIPFVRIYTAKVTDMNYVYPVLAVLFFSQIYAQVINRPFGLLLNATGNFKMQNFQCGAAAVINIIVSVAFIRLCGINSIIIGSFVGTLIILVMNIYQVYKYVLRNNLFYVSVNIILNYIIDLLLIFISFKICDSVNNVSTFCVNAVIVGFVDLITIFGINFIVDRKRMLKIIGFGFSLIRKKEALNNKE